MGAISHYFTTIEKRKEWEDLWWVLAENDVTKYNEIRRLEVVQFYNFLKRWKIAMEKRTKNK